MSDTYQAVYDAVRSRIYGGDVSSAVESALQNAGFSEQVYQAGQAIQAAANNVYAELTSPSAIYRPKLSVDGNQWCARYGDDLQSGVAGFGDSPALAMEDFNRNWVKPLFAAKEK